MSKRHAWVANFLSGLAIAACTESPATMGQVPASQAEGLHAAAVRVRIDSPRARRWELGWGAASVYDVGSGRLVRRIPLTGASLSVARGTCRPDLVVSRSGAVIVSSNAEPVLWRIDPASFEVRRYDIALDSDRTKDFGFSALAWDADERTLYAASAVMGTLWRIDLDAATASRIELTAPIRGACALAAPESAAGTQTLIVATGVDASLWRVSLSRDLDRGNVTDPGGHSAWSGRISTAPLARKTPTGCGSPHEGEEQGGISNRRPT